MLKSMIQVIMFVKAMCDGFLLQGSIYYVDTNIALAMQSLIILVFQNLQCKTESL
jgi:hypothetical protein